MRCGASPMVPSPTTTASSLASSTAPAQITQYSIPPHELHCGRVSHFANVEETVYVDMRRRVRTPRVIHAEYCTMTVLMQNALVPA